MFAIKSDTFITAPKAGTTDGITFACCSLNIAQQRDAAQDPVVGVLRTLQIDRGDVSEISSTRFLIDRTRIHLQIHVFRQVGRDQDDGQRLEEDLWLRFRQSCSATVPPRPL